MTVSIKTIYILGLTFVLLSCGQQTDEAETNPTESFTGTGTSKATLKTTKTDQDEETISSYQQELNKALSDTNIDLYYKDIFRQEKLIPADDNKMLSITDSLFSKNPEKDLFYFVVFTKSMNGSDGFYSEALGLASYNFITINTEWFADYFNIAPKLTENDMDNWANYIFGEIQISRENNEVKAIKELEGHLLDNIKEARKEYKVVIEKLIEKIKSTAHNRGYKI